MTTPLPSSRIDDLLSELQLLEERPLSSDSISFIPVAPPRLMESQMEAKIQKEEVKETPAPLISEKKSANNTFSIAAVCSLLFFALGLFSADFFITEGSDSSTSPTQIDLSGYHPLIASLHGQFENLFKERNSFLLSAIAESSTNLNQLSQENGHRLSLALLNAWDSLEDSSLRAQFVELASKEGLSSFLPAQVTSEEKLRPLYYYSDSKLDLNLSQLHTNILNDFS